ncbi:MAG TPA: DMT family transporter [Firmicutes bacterium]|nr:DMT family transporter [Candidatus Fermentithermobacillaceae bacterium]
MSQLSADLLLLLVTVAWGTTFVVVKNTVETMGPFTYLAVRFLIAGVILLFWHIARAGVPSKGHRLPPGHAWYEASREFYLGGILTGLALFFSYATQTLGLMTVAAGKAAFITGLYVVIVPIASRALAREAPDRPTLAGVILAAVGLALMSLNLPFQVARGDFLVFLCALGFSAHILLVSHYSGYGDTVLYTAVQLLVVALASGVAALIAETPLFIPASAWPAILFTSIVTTALAFLVQSTVQRYTSATHTALIFSAEPVFGAVFAWLLAGEVLLPREMAGAVLILAGMLVAEARNLRGSREAGAEAT